MASNHQVADECNNFAVSLFNQLTTESGENVFTSPFSISSALAMSLLGASENSAEQLKSVLCPHFKDNQLYHLEFSRLHKDITADKLASSVLIKLANRIYARKGYPIKEEFLGSTKNTYKAEAEQLDFIGDAAGSRETINKWVEEQTNDRIKDLLSEDSITNLTVLIIVNAIYFKGKWESPFKEESTRKDKFHISKEQSMEVNMMYQEEAFKMGYDRELEAKCLEIPYTDNALNMMIVLPTEMHKLPDLEKRLTLDKLDSLFSTMNKMKVRLFLPRFRLEYQSSMKSALTKMGVTDIFQNGLADLSGVDGTKELYVSDVVHKAFLEVNEEGSEAAAATGMMMNLMCMPPEFRVNQPFLVFIRHCQTGTILFMGRVYQPDSI